MIVGVPVAIGEATFSLLVTLSFKYCSNVSNDNGILCMLTFMVSGGYLLRAGWRWGRSNIVIACWDPMEIS